MSKKLSIGIDLGTTYSCVAYYQNGKVEIIENKNTGQRTTPSVVTFTDNERIIGKPSRMSENTVYEVKRLIGRKFDDEHVVNDSKKWPFKIINQNSKPLVQVMYKKKQEIFHPEQISAMILARMKEIADLHLAQTVVDAVITVPAYFNDSQRLATKDAAQIAGLNVLKIINEPTASAIAYGFDKKITTKKNILVFDLGGGTFDVSIMKIESGQFKVIAIGGDTHLGGCDFDNRLVEYFIELYRNKYCKEISENKKTIYKLRTHCEIAKRALSEAVETTIEIDAFFDGEDFVETVSRALFERLNDDLFNKTIEVLRTTLEESKLKKNEIDDVILIGGSIRIPKIQNLIKEFFNGKQPFQNINPDEAVAYGAAIQAAILSDKTNPDFRGLQIVDVTPLSLGISITHDNIMSELIHRNTSIPYTISQVYTTSVDYQSIVNIEIYEGERPLVKDNLLLGEFVLDDIQSAPACVPKIDVEFTIDGNGILTVSARDKSNFSQNSIKINNANGHLTQNQINQMILKAKRFVI
jgi:heat shock 70kDa protein 1/2/6/8